MLTMLEGPDFSRRCGLFCSDVDADEIVKLVAIG